MTVPQSRQEWLDLIIKTSLEGGFPSVEYDGCANPGRCVYLSPTGRMCVIGLLIDREKYSSSLEGNLRNKVLEVLPEWAQQLGRHVLSSVQACHDSRARGPWDHKAFVENLRNLNVFTDCKFPEEAAA